MAEMAMLVLQAVCSGVAAYQGLWWKATYWLGALIITVAIIKGMKA